MGVVLFQMWFDFTVPFWHLSMYVFILDSFMLLFVRCSLALPKHQDPWVKNTIDNKLYVQHMLLCCTEFKYRQRKEAIEKKNTKLGIDSNIQIETYKII